MTDDITTMTCDCCGRNFRADARACIEVDLATFIDCAEDGATFAGEDVGPLTVDLESREQMKRDMELTDAELDELLATGILRGVGRIICLPCQMGAGLDED